MIDTASMLPHRDPILFVDGVDELVAGESAQGWWELTGDEAFFAGHFPGRPTLPGVLMAEAIAQLGAIAVLSHPDYVDRLPLFGGLDKARFRRQVGPGDRLDLSVEMTRLSARAGKGHGSAHVAGELACSCELLFVLA
jgi:3-hydroxyacyl-[acyl-carrier-protein] dehydratase